MVSGFTLGLPSRSPPHPGANSNGGGIQGKPLACGGQKGGIQLPQVAGQGTPEHLLHDGQSTFDLVFRGGTLKPDILGGPAGTDGSQQLGPVQFLLPGGHVVEIPGPQEQGQLLVFLLDGAPADLCGVGGQDQLHFQPRDASGKGGRVHARLQQASHTIVQ